MRFRRAAREQRQQIKWVALAGSMAGATVIVFIALYDVVGENVANPAILLSVMGMPISAGIAILRHRLYDIDVVINRALVYGVLTLLLAGAYAATTLVLGTALGSGSGWTTAGATLAVAAAFRPLRARVQDMMNRRFARARYDAFRRIATFLEELRSGRAAPEHVEPLLREIVQDAELELRLFLPESQEYVDARGRALEDARDDSRERTPIERAGQPLGMVLHGPGNQQRPGFLSEVVAAAGLAIEIARLRVGLRRQLEEVEASRTRIVSAGYEERRRIERDLHDGAQQRLVSIGLALRHVQHELGDSPNGAVAALDGPVDEIALAIQELRVLARGVRPAQLDEGLAPALRE
ncbi:MAG: histidine kinase, partial [Actinobacteria bacterium]|nr:histidine kinase [Actinomycetota bacterium]